MISSFISKVDKARRYAAEPNRIDIRNFTATFRGDHDEHEVSCIDGAWHCNCPSFTNGSICCHTMAVQRVLSTAGIPDPGRARSAAAPAL